MEGEGRMMEDVGVVEGGVMEEWGCCGGESDGGWGKVL